MSKRKYPTINIGSSSMLVVFIILCLVTFSVLSVASANNDRKYSEKIADRTTAYYKASNKAEEFLSQIDDKLKQVYEQYNAGSSHKCQTHLQVSTELTPLIFLPFLFPFRSMTHRLCLSHFSFKYRKKKAILFIPSLLGKRSPQKYEMAMNL